MCGANTLPYYYTNSWYNNSPRVSAVKCQIIGKQKEVQIKKMEPCCIYSSLDTLRLIDLFWCSPKQ